MRGIWAAVSVFGLLVGFGAVGWAGDVNTLLTRVDDGDRLEVEPDAWGTGELRLLEKGTLPLVGRNPGRKVSIRVGREKAYQTMYGLGAAMTDSSAYVLMGLKERDPGQFEGVMQALFSARGTGAGFSMLRLPMGASDYAATEEAYTYCDVPSEDLSRFTIARDREYVIPALREAIRINPEIRLIGSPWSAPAWMKTNGRLEGVTKAEKGAGTHCRLKPDFFDLYADYFVKFIEAYAAEGIPIWGVTLQNEPQFDAARYPCMRMSAEDQIKLVRALGPKLEARGLATRIYVHDHNWGLHPNDREPVGGDVKRDPVEVVTRIMNDPEAGKYVAGSAWHCYFGDAGLMRRVYGTVHERFPDKDILCTELSGWGKSRGKWWGDVAWGMEHNWMGGLQNHAQASLQWNLALDENHGPSLRDDSEGLGLVTIPSEGGRVRFEREYFAMAQMSRAARPGARRVEARIEGQGVEGLEVVAFELGDGGATLVVFNKVGDGVAFQVEDGGRFFEAEVPARSILTCIWEAD